LKTQRLEHYGFYYDRLLDLRDPETDKNVLSTDLARILSEDFQRLPEQRPESLKGVFSRQVSESDSAVVYHLTNGFSVKIERKTGDDSVSIIRNINTFPAN
jgi:hypothetical protein